MNTAYGESRSCRVLDQRLIGNRARLLRLERAFNFESGQSIGLSDKADLAPRRYSVASAPSDPWFEVLYTVVEEGALTPRLDLLEEGDEIFVYEPSGAFADPGSGKVWWVANGTGVAPFASFFRSGVRANRTLIHGVRTKEEAYFEQEFRSADSFDYIVCASQDEPWHPSARHGRLTVWLQDEGSKLFRKGDRFMLCGSSGMVVDTREILIGLGYRHDDIDCEIYF